MKYLYNTPINMPRGTHYGSDYWITFSRKIQRKVHLYSMLEYANFLSLEMNSNVEYFCEQPLKISDSNTNNTQTVFDFWVYFADSSTEFQEVKYSTDLVGSSKSSIRSKKQIEFQKEWCHKHGYIYKVVTEKELYKSEYYITNLSILHSFLLRQNISISPESKNKLYDFLSNGVQTISTITELGILERGQELVTLSYLFYKGKIEIDILHRPLDKRTEIRLCENANTIF